jgi:hypothetical protein
MLKTIVITMLSWLLMPDGEAPPAIPQATLTQSKMAVQAQPEPIEKQIEDLMAMFQDVSTKTDGNQIMTLTLVGNQVKGEIKTVPDVAYRTLVCSGSARQFAGCARDYLAEHGCMIVTTGECGSDYCDYSCTD